MSYMGAGHVRASYQMMMRLAARAFYAGRCPPPERDPDRENPRSKLNKVDTTGLAVVIIDYLTTQEWVSEEVMTKALGVHMRLLRKALTFLEREHMLRVFERKEVARKPGVVDAAMEAVVAQPDSDEDEDDEDVPGKPKKLHLKQYYVIDYSRAFDALQLRIAVMRRRLRDQLEARVAVQSYLCEACGKSYTSMDAMAILDLETGEFRCDICQDRPLLKQVVAGEALDELTRKQRHEATKKLLQAVEGQVAPLIRLMADLAARSLPPPEYGELVDWAKRHMHAENKAAAAAGARGGGPGGARGGLGAHHGAGQHGVVILSGSGGTAAWEEGMTLQIGGSAPAAEERPAKQARTSQPWFLAAKQEPGSGAQPTGPLLGAGGSSGRAEGPGAGGGGEGGGGDLASPGSSGAGASSGPTAFERKLQAILAAKLGKGQPLAAPAPAAPAAAAAASSAAAAAAGAAAAAAGAAAAAAVSAMFGQQQPQHQQPQQPQQQVPMPGAPFGSAPTDGSMGMGTGGWSSAPQPMPVPSSLGLGGGDADGSLVGLGELDPGADVDDDVDGMEMGDWEPLPLPLPLPGANMAGSQDPGGLLPDIGDLGGDDWEDV